MRKGLLVLAVAAMMFCTAASAELQNVQVGGEVRIMGNWIPNWAVEPGPLEIRIPATQLFNRPIGDMVTRGAFNGAGILSPYAWGNTNDLRLIEERTRVNFKAEFTDNVSAFIELESYDFWGEDFRSNYVTGADARAATGDDVEVYQSYIETSEMYGYPVSLRIGRQELAFGNQWLVGPKDFGPFFRGRSFDAIRATYATDLFKVDAWMSKLNEGGVAEQDGDVDFYGVYGTYLGLENITIDAYWMLVRDGRSLNDTNRLWFGEWIEDVLNLDDYDVTNLNTVGLRGAGKIDAFDFDAEVAYQFGSADQVGFAFKPFTYGDDGADYGVWGANLGAGYTFDMMWQPRLHLGYTYYGGEDNRDINFWQWLNPFDLPEASVSFNRLFTNVMHGGFLDLQGDFSNGHVFEADVMAHPTEKTMVMLGLTYFMADETFSYPMFVKIGKFRVPVAPNLSFWDKGGDSDIGWQLDLVGAYNYSEDLSFMLHWSHMFVGDGLSDGNFNAWNGLLFTGGDGEDDSDYYCVETRIRF